MKKSLLIVFLFIQSSLYAQQKTQNFAGLYNRPYTTTIGFGVGAGAMTTPGSKTYGIHFELIGWGDLLDHSDETDSVFSDTEWIERIRNRPALTSMSGLNISTIGTICRRCAANGITAGAGISITQRMYGASFALFVNDTRQMAGLQMAFVGNSASVGTGLQIGALNASDFLYRGIQAGAVNVSNDVRGLQIGLFNYCKKLKGLQIGVWNKNGKRSFPIINW